MKKRFLLIPLLFLPLTSCIKDTAKVSKVELSGNISDAVTRNRPLSSKGDNNILYIPLNFDASYDTTSLTNLNIALTGSKEETGYYSVKEYMSTSSYNKLNLNIDLGSTITSTKTLDYYKENNEIEDDILSYLSSLDLEKYDNNKDNYIDYVCFVYKTNTISDYSFSARFQNNFTLDLKTKINDTYKLSNVSFVDYDSIVAKYESYYDTKSIVSDSHQLVHELGYALGLLDEFNKDDFTQDSSMYFTTMMSGVTGDFSSSDKLLLGWANAYTTSGKYNVHTDILPFVSSGDVILWSDHTITSVFDEYVTLEIYSNELLNSNARVVSQKTNDTFYTLKVTKVNNTLQKNSNGKIYSVEKKYDNSAFKYDYTDDTIKRSYIKLSTDYDLTSTFYKAYFYKAESSGAFSEQFVETLKIPSLTYAYLSTDEETKKSTISLTL